MIVSALKRKISCFFFLLLPLTAPAQVTEGETLDRVMAVVGNEIVLRSDIDQENQKEKQMRNSKTHIAGNSDCVGMERLMFRNLILNQAKVDSVTLKESRVDSEMDRRLRYFVRQMGSRDKLEEFYGMSIQRIKEEFRPGIKEQLRVKKMRRQITSDLSVTPSEVQKYFEQLHEDSIPLIDASVRIAHIVKKPELGDKAIRQTRERLERFKEQIESGEKEFSVLATLYSDDPGSAGQGGELGFVKRGEMMQEFEAAIFNLEEGEFSDIIRTEHGFHLAQVREKRGQKVKARHILLKPKVGTEEVERVKQELDSIAKLVRTVDTLTFEEAAQRLSDDEKTRKSGGLIVNRKSGSSSFSMDELDPKVTFAIENMKVGQISEPVPYKTKKDKAYRIIKLLESTEPHKASLETDYLFLKKEAKKKKEERKIRQWVNERIDETYIRVNGSYRSCDFQHPWLQGNEQ